MDEISTDNFPLTRYKLVNCKESTFQTKIILNMEDEMTIRNASRSSQSDFTHPRVCTHELGRNYVSCTIGRARLNVSENCTKLLSNRRGIEHDSGLKTRHIGVIAKQV
jgi:hypothetical protein